MLKGRAAAIENEPHHSKESSEGPRHPLEKDEEALILEHLPRHHSGSGRSPRLRDACLSVEPMMQPTVRGMREGAFG